VGIVAVWINLGAVFDEAAMWQDMLHCMTTAGRLANELQVNPSSGLAARALHGEAVAHWLLGSYETAIARARSAVDLLRDSTSQESEVVKAVTEMVMCKALLAMGRLEEAEQHANRASIMALRSGSTRAQTESRIGLALVNVLRHPSAQALAALEAQKDIVSDFSQRAALLRGLIDVYEKLGRTDRAAVASRELLQWARKAQSAAISQAVDASHRLRLHPQSSRLDGGEAVSSDLQSLAARCGALLATSVRHE
jgi:tetratricopeptide (TPR) repeat protein